MKQICNLPTMDCRKTIRHCGRFRRWGVHLALQIVDVALHTGQAGRDRLQGRVIQGLHFALVLLHQGLDLLVGVACGLIGRGVEGLLGNLTLVGLVLVVVGLVVDVRLAEIVLVVLNGLDQLLVLALDRKSVV